MQSKDFPFISGAQEHSDEKVAPAPSLVVAENLRVTAPGGIGKRRGVDQLGYGETGPNLPKRLVSFEDELLMFDSERLHVESSNVGFAEIEDTSATCLDGKEHLAAYAGQDVIGVACAATLEREVHAWTSSDGSTYNLHIMVKEVGGSVLTPATLVESSANSHSQIKAVVVGTRVIVLWGSVGSTLKAMVVSTSTEGPWSSGDIVTVVSDCAQGASNFFDADTHSTGAVIAYNSSTATTSVTVATIDNTATVLDTLTINAGHSDTKVGIVGDVNNVHLHVIGTPAGSATHICYRLATPTLSVTSSYSVGPSADYGTTTGFVTGRYSSTVSAWAVAKTDSTVVRTSTGISGAGLYASDPLYALYPVSKLWTVGARVYMAAQQWHDQANSYSSIVSLELASGHFNAARTEMRFASGRTPEDRPDNIAATIGAPYSGVSSGSALEDSAYIIPIITVNRTSQPELDDDPTDPEQTTLTLDASSFRLNLNSQKQFLSAELGGLLYTGGGQIMQYDGRRLTELGFWSWPNIEASSFTVSSTGGSIADGSYTYAAVWEWYDCKGARHQSTPSLVTVVVAEGTGTASVAITIPSLTTTRKHWRLEGGDARPVVCAIYRTENSTVTTVPALRRLEGAGVPAFLENDYTAANSGTWTDVSSDASAALASRELLYSTIAGAGELNNVPPPPARVLIAHQDRLHFILDENPYLVGYTKYSVDGFGLAWNESLVNKLPEKAIALASQDGNLVVFSEHSVFTITDQASSNTGQQTHYEGPQRVSSETGCVDPRSVLSTPVGIVYQSQRGIEVLPRGGFGAEWLGSAIVDTLELYPIITSVVHIPESERICWSVVNSEDYDSDSDSRVLVYDYRVKQWFVYNYGDGFPIRSLGNDGGNLTICGPGQSGVDTGGHLVWREGSTFRDQRNGGDSHIDAVLETADIRDGIAADSRMRSATIQGRTVGDCDVTVTEYHGTATSAGTKTWSVTAEDETLLRYTLRKQKSPAGRLRIDIASSGTVDSAGVELQGMRLQFKPLRAAARLPAGQQ